jgi:Icc-related predicted phosphoesterase
VRILAISDEECAAFWDYYTPGMLRKYDLILSSGDLKAEYLSFLVTMARCPLLYVHGNHDSSYADTPPEGCDCIDDKLVVYKGLRILGLGGSRQYSRSAHQYSEKEMRRRIRKLRRAIKQAGGVDVVLAHAAPLGVGDAQDLPHRGFEAFLELIEQYRPQVFLHGHVHLNYGMDKTRVRQYGDTQVINVTERYTLELPEVEIPEKHKNQLIWKTKPNKH